jgi:toxin CcdB
LGTLILPQFGVYRNRTSIDAEAVPFFLDLQNDLFSSLRSRVVAPLRWADAGAALMPRLNPTFKLNGVEVRLMTHELLYLPVPALGETVASLDDEREAILQALDLLIVGF